MNKSKSSNNKNRKKTAWLHGYREMFYVAVVILILLATVGIGINKNSKSTRLQANSKTELSDKKETLDIIEGKKLDVSEEALENVAPTSSQSGECKYLYSNPDNNGYSISVRQSDGSYKCVTFNINDLKNYTSTSKYDESNGRTIVQQGAFKDEATGTTTYVEKYDDGSSKISTEGGYYKLYLNKKSTMYVFVNGYEMARRFQYCKTIGFMDENNQLDVRLYTDAEQREIASQPYPFEGPDCNAGNFPEVRYE